MTYQIEDNVTQSNSLYEQDFYLWLETTVKLLQQRELGAIDYENLIEELAAMGRSEKDSLESNLIIVLMHLLKYKYEPERLSNSWLSSIFEHRRRIEKSFKNSPSLKIYLAQIFDDSYRYARKKASIETGLSLNTFPLECPFSQEDTLNFDYLPIDLD